MIFTATKCSVEIVGAGTNRERRGEGRRFVKGAIAIAGHNADGIDNIIRADPIGLAIAGDIGQEGERGAGATGRKRYAAHTIQPIGADHRGGAEGAVTIAGIDQDFTIHRKAATVAMNPVSLAVPGDIFDKGGIYWIIGHNRQSKWTP